MLQSLSEVAIGTNHFTMRQSELDRNEDHDSAGRNPASERKSGEQAPAGSKRKNTASPADEEGRREENGDGAKSRKTESSQNNQAENTGHTQKNGSTKTPSAPVNLSSDQRKVDNKLKGDDVEHSKETSASHSKKSDDAAKEVPWHVSEKGL